jgi:hypothetical protein
MNSSILKIVALGTVAGLMMGNTSCQNQTAPAPQARVLRRLVEVGKISAQPIQLPDNQVFDLQFVINQQFPDVLVGSQQYTVINRDMASTLPAPGTPLAPGTPAKSASNLSVRDEAVLNKIGVGADAWYGSQEAECLINMPQFRLDGVVNSYEWVSGGGLTVGYSPTGSHTVTNVGGSVHFDKAQMDLTLRALNPVDRKIMDVANVTQNQIKTKVAFDISFGTISIGPEFYYQKGLAEVTKEALNLALASLRVLTDSEPWYTRAGEVQDNFVTIVGGDDIKLQAGDQVSFQNARYRWDSEKDACDPAHYIGYTAGQVVALGTVVDVGDHISTVQIDQNSMKADIMLGAMVKMVKMAAPAPAAP